MLVRGEIAKAANEGLWVLKFLLIGTFFFACLYIPNSFFQWYIDFARVVSGYLIFSYSKTLFDFLDHYVNRCILFVGIKLDWKLRSWK
jgi:hypothetical protein